MQALHAVYYTTVVTFPILVTIVFWGVLYESPWFPVRFDAWSNVRFLFLFHFSFPFLVRCYFAGASSSLPFLISSSSMTGYEETGITSVVVKTLEVQSHE